MNTSERLLENARTCLDQSGGPIHKSWGTKDTYKTDLGIILPVLGRLKRSAVKLGVVVRSLLMDVSNEIRILRHFKK